MGFSFAAFINIFGPRLVKRGLCAEGQRTNSGGDDAIARSRWNREVINEFFYVEFTAVSHDDALRIFVAEFLPDSVRTFGAEIVVREIKLRQPKSAPPAIG